MSLLLLLDDGPSPAFSANFLSGSLPAGLTYTNSSTTRTYFGSDGLLKTAAANEAIFEYDPLTRALLGMRWEMEKRTNLLLRSQEIDNASWIKVASTVSANAISSPDGTANAESVIEDASTASHGIRQDITTSAATYTFSIFLKASGRNWVLLHNTTANYYAYFDISNGAVGSTHSTSSESITPVGGGWYRCSISGAATAASNAFRVYSATSNGILSYLGNGLSSFYAWGAQLEAGASASSYIPTAAAAVTRQPDVLPATSISPWFNASEGTVVFEGIASATEAVNRGYYAFTDGTIANRILAAKSSLNTSSQVVISAGVAGLNQQLGTITSGVVFRSALAYKLNNSNSAANGVVGTTDTTVSIPATNQLSFGGTTSTGTEPFMGYARRFSYYRTRFPDATIQGMTSV